MDGKVRCTRLVVSESGVVSGEIEAEAVTVRGQVDGSIRARVLALSATARVQGDILHQALEVESGAVVQGRVRQCRDPLAERLPENPADGVIEQPERRRADSAMRAVDSREAAQERTLRAAG